MPGKGNGRGLSGIMTAMKIAVVGLVALALGMVAACGDDESDVRGTGTAPAATTADTTNPATTSPAGTTSAVATTSPAPNPSPAPGPAAPAGSGELDGQTYTTSALTVDGTERPGANGSTFTVSFAGGRVLANAGCNQMSSDYRVEDGRLVAGPFVGTLMACDPPEVMEQDSLMTELLAGRPAVSAAADGTLTLTGERIVFAGTAATLDGRTFVADSLTVEGAEQPAIAGTRITIAFAADGRMSANAGCNQMSGAYRLDGGRLMVAGLAATQMFCDAAHAAQDALVSELLTSGPAVTLTADRLVLDGGRIRFDGLSRQVADPDRPLVGTTWNYNGLISQSAISIGRLEATVTLAAEGTATVAGCRTATGTFTAEGDRVTVTLEPPTGAACADALVAQEEDQLLANLAGTSTVTIEAGSARLVRDDGNGVMLRAAP